MPDSDHNGLNFLERIGVVPAYRQPSPALDVQALEAVSLDLADWTPLADQLGHYDGDPPPDRGQTLEWPPEL